MGVFSARNYNVTEHVRVEEEEGRLGQALFVIGRAPRHSAALNEQCTATAWKGELCQ